MGAGMRTTGAEAEQSVLEYLRGMGLFESIEITIESEEIEEGWLFSIRPANSYLRRHRANLSASLFVDRTDGRVHHIPSSGPKALIARLRGQL
jgi:hypothetical protein